MSLLRLLTAGKSLIGGSQTVTRYRAAHQGMLPKFGGKKNPFRATARADGRPGIPEPAPVHAATASDLTPAEERQARRLDTAPPGAPAPAWPTLPESAGKTSAPQSPRPVGRVGQSGVTWMQQCWADMKLLFVLKSWLPWRRSSPKPVPQRFAKPLVQTELSLDSIKVVRNDLSDSDIEVVPARPLVVAGPGEILEPGSKPDMQLPALNREPAGTAWTRVSARLFGAGKF